mmetsp:Transcript_35127/g.76901  ORF Transcript_35127/g.76901 Transcript_35127/m.76901 type:complete len:263 (+) Transcript_35127:26-814(+)
MVFIPLGPVATIGRRGFSSRGGHSRQWIQRHLHDRYVLKAQAQDYRSRAAFKLKELDDKCSIFRRNQLVLDLGCHPGGFSQVALERTMASSSKSRVIGVDLQYMDSLGDKFTFLQGDVTDPAIFDRIIQEIGPDRRADVVMSDMAPAMVGIKGDDHLNIVELCMHASHLMERTLKIGGWFMCKMFQGPATANFKLYMQTRFKVVKGLKPKASRRESPEMYLVGHNFIGRESIASESPTNFWNYPWKEGLELDLHYTPRDKIR